MKIHRRSPVIEKYHYDNLKENRTNQELHLSILPLEESIERLTSTLGLKLDFSISIKSFVVSGCISQIVHIKGKNIVEKEDLKDEELSELAAPLLDLIGRMTYEVSEIALNEPGTALNFSTVLG